jgi:sialate O-acetylesterase
MSFAKHSPTFSQRFQVHAKSRRRLHWLLLVLPLTIGSALADVALPAFFSNNAVLQRDKPLPIWGTAAAGEPVQVTLGSKSMKTTAGADGRWRVILPPQAVSKEALTLSVVGKNTITCNDILLGDVWLCSGQSNMSMNINGFPKIPEYAADLQAANATPLIHHYAAKDVMAVEEQANIEGRWEACSTRTVPGFTAVGYHFARRVHAATGVPIGIIRAAKGSTVIELWLSLQTLLTEPQLKQYGDKLRAATAKWEQEKQAALAAGKQPDAPDFPPHPLSEASQLRPHYTTRYNSMIAPFGGMALRGIIWYQAETNSLTPQLTADYPALQRALVSSWRKLFNDPQLPFLYVQLPNYREVSENPNTVENWALMRESQAQCLDVPNTHMAVTIDIGQADDIHPSNKYDVGERLGALALRNVYGQSAVVARGPVFKELQIKGGKVVVSFTELGGGLIVGRKDGRAPLVEDKGGKLARFAIAGADKKFVWADAVIAGDTVVVSSPEVPNPVAVRYAFASNPAGANLYNRAGLPAAPFRTDTWK